jgi:hypothetical protein
MDDGYKSKKGFYFCSESYTLEENEKLVNLMENKFDLKSSVHKHSNGHRLYIKSVSRDNFISLVKPFIINHFNYKLQ